MSILKNKMLLLLPIIVLVVIFVFALILIPSVNSTPKNLPVAIVNEDQGFNIPNQGQLNMGNTIVDNIKNMSSITSDKDPVIEWIEVESYEAVQTGLNNQEYYAALVIPKDYSAKQFSLMTPNPSSPELEIFINQGMNATTANMISQMLNGIVDNINSGVRTQLMEGFEEQGGTITTELASLLVSPITKKVTNVNEIGANSANGNAPVIFLQPLWMACIAGAAVLFTMRKKYTLANRTEGFITLLVEVLEGAVLALVAGFGLTWIASGLLGLNIPQFTDTALFLSITYFSFFLMILATISWIGLRGGLAIYVIILFFGAPLLAMPPEFLSPFYRDWIYSWLPMRYMVDGLRELFFFSKELSWNQPTAVLVGIGLVSLLILLASVLKSDSSKKINSELV